MYLRWIFVLLSSLQKCVFRLSFSQIMFSSLSFYCQCGMGLERFVSQLLPVAFWKGTGTYFSVSLSRWDGENLLLVLSWGWDVIRCFEVLLWGEQTCASCCCYLFILSWPVGWNSVVCLFQGGPSKLVQKHLSGLFNSIASFYHPSNNGRWLVSWVVWVSRQELWISTCQPCVLQIVCWCVVLGDLNYHDPWLHCHSNHALILMSVQRSKTRHLIPI